MKAIILAAGNGRRLYPYTKHIPKCLLDIDGETILERQINYIRDCGINEVVIVVGYKYKNVEDFLRKYDSLGMRIKTLYNPFYKTTNSLVSLWIAIGEMDQDIVIMNGDDVFEIEVLERVLAVRDQQICLPVKVKPHYDEEDMKVFIKDMRIVEIGKTLTNGAFGESVGVRMFRGMGVEIMKKAIEEEIRTKGAREKWYVSAIQRLIKKGCKVNSLDINNLFWMDVDDPNDLNRVRFNSNKIINKPYEQRILRVV